VGQKWAEKNSTAGKDSANPRLRSEPVKKVEQSRSGRPSPLACSRCLRRCRDANCRIRLWPHLSVCLFSSKVRESAFTRPAKITLFRSLFHGREDVYPQRFESRKTGRAGYSPASAMSGSGEFARNRDQVLECPHQRFLRITDEIIRCISAFTTTRVGNRDGRLSMLRDETCFFLAPILTKQRGARCGRISGNMSTNERARCPGAVRRQRRARLVLFQ